MIGGKWINRGKIEQRMRTPLKGLGHVISFIKIYLRLKNEGKYCPTQFKEIPASAQRFNIVLEKELQQSSLMFLTAEFCTFDSLLMYVAYTKPKQKAQNLKNCIIWIVLD